MFRNSLIILKKHYQNLITLIIDLFVLIKLKKQHLSFCLYKNSKKIEYVNTYDS